MWARVVEVMLACWLGMSPFIFQHSPDNKLLWASDFATALAVATFSLLSYWPPMRRAHLLNLAVAGWMVIFGRFWQSPPLAPGLQNEIVVGLLLMMTAIVPTEASQPPLAWRTEQPEGR